MTEEMPEATADEFFASEATAMEEELTELVASVNETMLTNTGTPLIISACQSLHFIGLGQRLMEAARLAFTIGGYLIPMDTMPTEAPEVVDSQPEPGLEEMPPPVKRKQPPVRVPWSDLPQ